MPTRRKKWHLLGQLLLPLIVIALFSLALVVLHHELGGHKYREIISNFAAIGRRQVLLSCFFTVASYLVLTLYDALAIRYLHQRLPYRTVAFASFAGYTLSHNLGFSVFTGGAIRYRILWAAGLSGLEIAKAIAFSGITFWVGYFFLTGLVLIFFPLQSLHWIVPPTIIGVIFFAIACLYLVFCALRLRPIKLREVELDAPPFFLSLGGIAIAAADWLIAAAVTYALLPHDKLPFLEFVGVFQLAQVAGFLSHIPGGLGVFETTMLLMLSAKVPPAQLAAALLAYRMIYYIAPLIVSLVLLIIHEVRLHHQRVARAVSMAAAAASTIIPHFLTVLLFISGAVLLFSGATPAVRWRIEMIELVFPLPLIEAAHFLCAIVGAWLLILASGLRKKLDSAFVLSLYALLLGSMLSLIKGLDYEEAALLFVMFLLLLPARQYFYRRGSLFASSLDPPWLLAVGVALAGTCWLFFFAHRYLEFSTDLWTEFAFRAEAPRSFRATTTAVFLLVCWSLSRLVLEVKTDFPAATAKDKEDAAAVARQSKKSSACFALLPDKLFLFSQNRQAFIMYGLEGRSAVALGDPIGAEREFRELIWQFHDMCDRGGMYAVFYQAASSYLPYYIDTGLLPRKIGEEARVDLASFDLAAESKSDFRTAKTRFEEAGCRFEVVPREDVARLLPELKEISDAWLKEKNTKEKHFSLGSFDTDYLQNFSLALVRQDQKILAFANIAESAEKVELSIDLMRHVPEAPTGMMDYLLTQVMLWGKEQQYSWLNLGMAPVKGLGERRIRSYWNRLGALLFDLGEYFYSFEGLRSYIDKFDPVWEPKYLVAPGGLALPSVFRDISRLIAGGAV